MPMLTWTGKDKVVNHHHDVPLRVLQCEYAYTAPEGIPTNSTDNRIIHGDNLEALKSLLPEFEGRVNCIYIDPPYNTGNEGWVYNDAVNDPHIKKWLGQVVGKEGEDLTRHDKWLCMMYPRLKLLHRLLAKDGSIWISIGDDEVHSLRMLMDEIFGRNKFIASNVWQKRYSRENRGAIGDAHEYIIVYAKQPDSFKELRNKVPLGEKQRKVYKNHDPEYGYWRDIPMSAQGYRPNQMYEIIAPNGKKHKPPEGRCWSMIESSFKKLESEGRVFFGKDGKGTPRIVRYLSEVEGLVPWTWWTHEEVGHTDESRKEIQAMFGTQTAFDTPKPTRLIERVLQISTGKDAIVLDSFAGSGTTAHAVLKLNAQDGGNRRFILCEMMDYAETITAERVRRVMTGYGEGNKATAGLGGAFSYYTMGEPLFLPDDNLNEAVGVPVIRDYVAYTENIPFEARTTPDNPISPYLLGQTAEAAWLFHYEPNCTTLLDMAFLGTLRFGGKRPALVVVYADACLLSAEFLQTYGLVFKKIPRDITRF